MSQLQLAISSTSKTTYTRPDVLEDLPKIIDISFFENKERGKHIITISGNFKTLPVGKSEKSEERGILKCLLQQQSKMQPNLVITDLGHGETR